MHDVFCLMGPTASGKTALACELVRVLPLEIISVDSAMIYRDMTIGTAKPSPEEQAAAPHHLIDMLNPPESFSAAQFCSEVNRIIADIIHRGKWPLLTGGTMMYFNALQKGLSELPEADAAVRLQLLSEAEVKGWTAMHDELKRIDPSTAAKIHAHDRQRIQRALEVFYVSGKTLSSLRAGDKSTSAYRFHNFILFPQNRVWLHERIARRFALMLQQGFLIEVEQLLKKWQLPADCPAMRCVGYRQAAGYLNNEFGHEDFCEKSVAATRQLAKRQLTWLRHWEDAALFDCEETQSSGKIIALIAEILDNTTQKNSGEQND